MYYLVLLVLHDIDHLNAVLDAWEETGVSGVTIIPTAGLGRIRENSPCATTCRSSPASMIC